MLGEWGYSCWVSMNDGDVAEGTDCVWVLSQFCEMCKDVWVVGVVHCVRGSLCHVTGEVGGHKLVVQILLGAPWANCRSCVLWNMSRVWGVCQCWREKHLDFLFTICREKEAYHLSIGKIRWENRHGDAICFERKSANWTIKLVSGNHVA